MTFVVSFGFQQGWKLCVCWLVWGEALCVGWCGGEALCVGWYGVRLFGLVGVGVRLFGLAAVG